MKNYITNNWKKILIAIGIIAIVINLGYKLTNNVVMIDDYVENGKDINQDVIDKIDESTGETIKTPESLRNNTEMYRLLMIGGGLILGILIISAITENKTAAAKKKK